MHHFVIVPAALYAGSFPWCSCCWWRRHPPLLVVLVVLLLLVQVVSYAAGGKVVGSPRMCGAAGGVVALVLSLGYLVCSSTQ